MKYLNTTDLVSRFDISKYTNDGSTSWPREVTLLAERTAALSDDLRTVISVAADGFILSVKGWDDSVGDDVNIKIRLYPEEMDWLVQALSAARRLPVFEQLVDAA